MSEDVTVQGLFDELERWVEEILAAVRDVEARWEEERDG